MVDVLVLVVEAYLAGLDLVWILYVLFPLAVCYDGWCILNGFCVCILTFSLYVAMANLLWTVRHGCIFLLTINNAYVL